MEDLILKCVRYSEDRLVAYKIGGESDLVQVDVFQLDDAASINLDKSSARQLHEWLGRYLENSNG